MPPHSAASIPTYDAFGNVSGRYTFSGWADPNDGIMGDADVVIPGIWEYEAVSTPSAPPEPPAPQPSNPNTGDIPLGLIFAMWLISSAALIVLGIFRKKILR